MPLLKNKIQLSTFKNLTGFIKLWMKKGPHTNPDKLTGGLLGGLTNSETYGLNVKIPN